VLQRLVEAGLLEGRGERKGRSYHLTATTYQRFGELAAWVRQRGFEPIQQEQMVLQYVAAHGRITRREVAELCRVSPLQARDLPGRLVRRGDLVLRGSRRGAFDERPSKSMDESITPP
jgi:ATP-dependent DNA helicase RecG